MKLLVPDHVISQVLNDVKLSVGNIKFQNCLIREMRIKVFFILAKMRMSWDKAM